MVHSFQTGTLFSNIHADLDALVKHAPAFILVLDVDGVIVSVDPMAAAWLDRPADSLLGINLYRVWPSDSRLVEKKIRRVVMHRQPEVFEAQAGAQTAIIYLYPLQRGEQITDIVLFGQEISERLKTEEQIRLLAERLESKMYERTAELEAINQRLEEEKRRAEMLARFSQLLMSDIQDYKPLLQQIAESLTKVLGDMCFIVVFWDDMTAYEVCGIYHHDPDQLQAFRQALEGKTFPLTHTTIAQMIMAGSPFSARNISQQDIVQTTISEIHALIPPQGFFSVEALPLIANDLVVGILCLARDQNPNAYTSQDIGFLKSLCTPIALAIQNTRLLQKRKADQERLRGLSQQLVQIQEMQFKELARQLHDGIGQDLTAINVNLTLMQKDLPAECPSSILARLENSSRLVESMIERLRNTMAEFRPPMLDAYGLTSALYWYAGQFYQRTAIVVRVDDRGLSNLRMQPDVEIGLFRIAQEALNNVAKHAGVQEVVIRLMEDSGDVCMIVEDEGVGFSLKDRIPDKNWGLIIMRERAEAIGSKFQIQSEPGKGTRVIVRVPNIRE